MGIAQNFNKNLKKSIKGQTPILPAGDKFIFHQLVKNIDEVEDMLERKVEKKRSGEKGYYCRCADNTLCHSTDVSCYGQCCVGEPKSAMVAEYNVGDLKKVIRNLNEAKKCTYSFECKGGKICLKGRCKKNPAENLLFSPGTKLNETDTTYCKKRKLGKCCDGGDGMGCGKWVEDPENKKCTCSYAGPCCKGQPASSKGTKDVEQEMEEATSTASSGAYSTPRFWAKDKKNQKFNNKRWMPGAKFVKVKEKCKKFPYCNQGDINALEIWEKEIMRESAKNVSKKTGKSESEVREMIEKELAEIIRRSFYKSPIKDLVGTGKMDTPIGKMFSMSGNKPKYEK